MGDFNFDLLNYETDTGTAGFVNSIVQFGFLPLIHQPTRITGRSATIIDNIFANNFEHESIIDNIFANNFEHESISGNLLLKISDHLPQFSTIKKFHLDHKALNNYKHDYHKFDEDLFRDDFQIQIGRTLKRSVLDSSQKFDDIYWRLSACMERHASLIQVGKKGIRTITPRTITPQTITPGQIPPGQLPPRTNTPRTFNPPLRNFSSTYLGILCT